VSEQQPVTGSVPDVTFRHLSLGSLGTLRVSTTAEVLSVYVVSRLAIWFAAVYAASATRVGSLGNLLSGWDGQHYLDIVQHGYPSHSDLTHYTTVAFFPGFPLATRFVKLLLGLTPVGAGVAVSLVAGAGLVVVVTRLVATHFDEAAGRRAGILLSVFPGSFVLSLPYAESLALLLCASAFLATSKSRPIYGGALGALATFTSPIMLPIVPALLWRAWGTRATRDLVGALMTSLGFLAYMVYLWRHTGHLLAWFTAEHDGNAAHINLLSPITHLHYWPGIGLSETASLLVLAVALVAMRKINAPTEWWIFAGLVMAAVIFDSAQWVSPRFLLNAFPLLLALGVWLHRDALRLVLITFSLLLPVVFLAFMTLGGVTAQP
jgi:hypothetical protein